MRVGERGGGVRCNQVRGGLWNRNARFIVDVAAHCAEATRWFPSGEEFPAEVNGRV